MFETITFYENSVTDFKTTTLADGTYKVDIEFTVSKYRSDSKGNRSYNDTELKSSSSTDNEFKSLPLADYIDIVVFTEEEINGEKKEVELYLKKHKITNVQNTISIIVNKKPTAVGVDPYHKLIDTNSEDNRINSDR
ncbi:hypothetical protein [uncultured Kordia sp.]|uniref:hypothetical protein n=1 Tax=uncultured Kordia sp. TaxID=507699 RepID=UPI00261751E7|nr:hypothetical protein [uncultured Kordia sp.]